MAVRIAVRRDTTANWTAANPVLAVGEPALDTTTGYVKYGDGATPWVSLPTFSNPLDTNSQAVVDSAVANSAAAAAAASVASTAASTAATTAAGSATAASNSAAVAAAVIGTAFVRPTASKTVGSTVTAADAKTTSTWLSDVPFTVLLPADVSAIDAGSEFNLYSAGLGVGRVLPQKENLFVYPDAVAGFAGGIWSVRGPGTISVAAGAGPGGMDAIRVTSTGASSSGAFGLAQGTAYLNHPLSEIGVKPGDILNARAWVAPPPGQTARIQIRYYRKDVFLSEPVITGTTGTGYRYVIGSVVPDGATHAILSLLTTSTAAGQTADLAQISLVRGSASADDYVTGASAGGFWQGVPSQSPSSIGLLVGDSYIPAKGQSLLRYAGSGVWSIAPIGTAVDTVRTTDVLTVDRDNAQQGIVAPTYPYTTSDSALTSGRALFVRVAPSRDTLVQGIAFRVTTASGTDDPVDVGLYSAVGARLVSAGAVTGKLNVTGTQLVPLPPVLLQAGKIYYAAISSTSTASIRRGTVLADVYGSTLPVVESMYSAASHPLPASITTFVTSDAAPLLVLREVL